MARPSLNKNAPAARRVLVVDDEPDAADTLAEILRADGHRVRVAYSGGEAVEAFPSFRPDIVFLDLNMPKMDGYETARCLREHRLGKHISIIAVTGWAGLKEKPSGQACFDLQLSKPATVESLKHALSLKRRP